jgi:hypothetical protein
VATVFWDALHVCPVGVLSPKMWDNHCSTLKKLKLFIKIDQERCEMVWSCSMTMQHHTLLSRPHNGTSSMGGRYCRIPHKLPTWHPQTFISLGPSNRIYWDSGLWMMMTLLCWQTGYRCLTRISLWRASMHWYPTGTSTTGVVCHSVLVYLTFGTSLITALRSEKQKHVFLMTRIKMTMHINSHLTPGSRF